MLVSNWMSKLVITVDANGSIKDAIKLLNENNIRFLPVVDYGKLVGVVSDRDLKRASASDATSLEIHELHHLISTIKVKEIMTKDPITVPQDFSIEEAAQILLKNKISGLPVVDDEGRVVGIITQCDLFRILTTLTGVDRRGIQFAFQAIDRPNSMKTIIDIIRNYNGRIVNILTSYEKVPDGYRDIYIRAYQIDRARLPKLIEDLKKVTTMLYMIDHREKMRKIYLTQN